jgi:hypothetical protein
MRLPVGLVSLQCPDVVRADECGWVRNIALVQASADAIECVEATDGKPVAEAV